MDNRRIIQSFLDKPVRFYKVTLPLGNTLPSTCRPFHADTYAIPLEDFCNAVCCGQDEILKLIKLPEHPSSELYLLDQLSGKGGKQVQSVILSKELLYGLTFSLWEMESEPDIKARIVSFQRWIMMVVGQIRTGKLHFSRNRFAEFNDAPQEYLDLLQMRSCRELSQQVKWLAEKEGVRYESIYRRLRAMRGSNVITENGLPRKTRRAKSPKEVRHLPPLSDL